MGTRRWRTNWARWLLAVCALVWLGVWSWPGVLRAQDEDAWAKINESDGITVWRLSGSGDARPGFRGEVTMRASLEEIVGVMLDSKKHTQWMHRCEESSVLERTSSTRAIVYTRVDAPWPVWDRDAVLETSAQYNESHTWARMDFHTVDDSERYRPVPAHVVRMPSLVGSYELKQLAPQQTHIRYQVKSDIGGSVPSWIADMASKQLPHMTLAQLRDRVMEVTGR